MEKSKQVAYLLTFLGVVVTGQAIQWLLTPASHPAASGARIIAVWIQLAAGVILFMLALLSALRLKQRPTAYPNDDVNRDG